MTTSHPTPRLRPLLLVFTAFLLAVPAALFAQSITSIVPDGRPHRFEMRDKQFLIDGEPTLLAAGEMHFGRVLPEDWDLRLKQAKAMGLNTVSFYLFWNLCEPREGEFTFSGMTDVRRMLQLCQQNGLWAILRPGPYCCAEFEYGGIPWWTAKYPDVPIRSNHPRYVEWSRRYLAAVQAEVADLQVTKGGPLLMVQIENEYGMVANGNNDYLVSLERVAREAGFEVPLFTCDPFFGPGRDPTANIPGLLRGRNGLRNERDLEMTNAVIGDMPVFVPELYTAWFTGWGQPIATRNSTIEQVANWTSFLLEKNVSFCYYMFHGGTTFGFYNGCNEFLPVHTSYDYRAPVDEAGRVTEKYRALRALLSERLKITPPEIPADSPVIEIAPFQLTQHQPLLATLPGQPTRVAEDPVSMENLDQAYGLVLYRKQFANGLKGVLELREARDYAIVMVNGRTVGRSFIGYGPESSKVEVNETGPVTLDILTYNLGRISVITSARSQDRARKGLIDGAYLDGTKLAGWEMYSLPYENGVAVKASNAPHTGPTFYRGTFRVDRLGGSFLDMRQWHFGVVWVNGHNLGRFWDRGALRSLFVPQHWLKQGENEIVVLELHDAPARAEVSGGTQLIEEAPVPFAWQLDRFQPRPQNAPAPARGNP